MPVPKFQESPQYESFIENFAAQLDAWRLTTEPSDQFARRMTGLMRTAYKDWAEKKR